MTDLLRTLPHPRATLHRENTHTPSPPSPGGPFHGGDRFHWIGGNSQSPECRSLLRSARGDTDAGFVLCWSGTLASELFAGDIRNWTATGNTALAAWLDELLPPSAAGSSRQLGIVPHYTHLVSDVAGQMRLWNDRRSHGLASVLYPSGLIAPSMLRALDDHLVRSISNLGPRCSVCILEDIAHSSDSTDEHPCFDRVAWGEGILPHAKIEQLLREHLPTATPIILASQPPFFI
ncbi:MAG: hypothetical protein EXS15_07205 [Phycisphaerales bacterium]|nr:hypothetical protein [Phycisphaerales bacterium]